MRRLLALVLFASLAGCGVIDGITGPGGLKIDKFVATPVEADAR